MLLLRQIQLVLKEAIPRLLANMSNSDAPSQADVVTFKAFSGAPDAEKYPHVARWYKHIASFEPEFSALPGDASKAYTAYGPETTEMPTNPKDKPAAEEDDDMDLFGSDEDEEEDPEVVAQREARLAEYKKKKEGKVKPAAKSIVTLEVKPWGMFDRSYYQSRRETNCFV